MLKIFIDDRGRYKSNNGYGNLSRNIGIALKKVGCKVYYDLCSSKPWDSSLTGDKIEKFEIGIHYGKADDCDIALSISPPTKRIIYNIPNAIYTQNALHGLKKDWGQHCSEYDGVLVPGEFDKPFFQEWNAKTFICPQIIDNAIFQNREKWRAEGSDKFTFLFIGSFSYRKGVDLLIESFCRFSRLDNNASKLVMMCPGAKNINYLLNKIREINPYSEIELYLEDLSQEWICRHINRADVFVTLSRGEGWCMPVFESILCEKPVIVPNSTAMSEATPNNSILKVVTNKKTVKLVRTDFGKGFKNQYGEDEIASYDVDMVAAINAFTEMKENFDAYKCEAGESREYVLINYSHEKVGNKLKSILAGMLKQ
jgi:glycosyltransferase involved in cell wall biosynthesis